MATRRFFGPVSLALPALALVAAVAVALPSAATTRPVVRIEHVHLGAVLFSEKGFALYTYGRDTKGHSHCNASCLAAWPALTIAKGVTPSGVKGLGVIVRSNGQHQVTWRGRPLYTFTSDAKGAVTGNGVADFHAAILTKSSATTTRATTTTTKSYGY